MVPESFTFQSLGSFGLHESAQCFKTNNDFLKKKYYPLLSSCYVLDPTLGIFYIVFLPR